MYLIYSKYYVSSTSWIFILLKKKKLIINIESILTRVYFHVLVQDLLSWLIKVSWSYCPILNLDINDDSLLALFLSHLFLSWLVIRSLLDFYFFYIMIRIFLSHVAVIIILGSLWHRFCKWQNDDIQLLPEQLCKQDRCSSCYRKKKIYIALI